MRFLMLNWRDPENPMAGGAERVSLAYLRALVERGHEAWWFANNFPGASPEQTIDGIHMVRGGGRGTSVLAARRWYRTQPRFDLVIDQHHGIPWFAPWWCGTNCVAYIHEVLGPIWDSFYAWPLSAIGRWQERLTHRWYGRVPFWTPSESTRRRLQAHGVKTVQVLSNGIDLQPLVELEAKALESSLRLVAVSRLAPNKRVDHTIRATQRLNESGVATRLTIVGGGESGSGLRELAGNLGLREKVQFTGRVSEEIKNREMRQAHLLVHASVREGWGLNVTEANALGTPAVVYPVDGLVDSTIHRKTGLITTAETPESMADAIIELTRHPEEYDRYRRNAWERSKAFQWEQVLPPACDWLEQTARGESATSPS